MTDKFVLHTTSLANGNKTKQENWVGFKVIDLFPEQPVYIDSVLFKKRLTTEEEKQYTLQNGDVIYSAIRPSGGGGGGLVGGFIDAAVNIATLDIGGYTKQLNQRVKSISSNLGLIPDVNNPNFETDERKTRPQLTGSSNTTSNDVVPYIFGETRLTPFYGQKPFRLYQEGGALNKLKQYFVCGMNSFVFEDEKLGETPLSDYSSNSIFRRFAFGGTTNLSDDYVLETEKGEQLTYDKDTIVNQTSSSIYGAAVNNNTLTYDVVFEFNNTPIDDFSQKDFTLNVTYYKNNDDNTLLTETHNFIINDTDLVQLSGNTYRYTGTHDFVLSGADVFTTILETQVFSVNTTRETSSENGQELDCEVYSEELTCGAFNELRVLENGVNNYTGLVNAVVDTSFDNVKEIDFNFSFPQGLYRAQNDGGRSSRTAPVTIDIKDYNGTEYQNISDFNIYYRDIDGNKQPISNTSTTVDGATVTFSSPSDLSNADELFYRTIGVEVPLGKYTVRIRTADFTEKTSFDIGVTQIQTINYWYNNNPVNSQIFPKIVQVNLEAMSSAQLSGTLQQYNFLAKGFCNVWNGTDWDSIQQTSNPAAIIRYVLLNNIINPRAEDPEIIDNDSLVELYEYCEAEGFKVSGVVSQEYKVESFLDAVLDACRSVWTFSGGKYYFATDKPKAARQLFTQHNTYALTSTPDIGENVSALRMTYLNSETWTDEEFTVYWYDGQVNDEPKINTTDEDYQVLKQNIDFVTDLDVAKNIAAYRLELIQAKRLNYSFSVNLESLDVRLLDRILVSDSSNMQNSSSGLIKELIVSGGNITGFKLYSKIDIPTNAEIVIRSLNEVSQEIEINTYEVANSGQSDIIELDTPIVNNGVIRGKGTRQGLNQYSTWYYDGDMFEIGQGNIVECVVDAIVFNNDLTAKITAREA